ncbi:MAG: MFS transporter [Opitutales bacterium]
MVAFVRKFLADVRSLPRSVHVLVVGQFINRFGSFVLPFLALFLSDRGIGLGQVALVLGAMSAGGLLAPVASGYLADAIGRRNTIVLSLATSAVTVVLLYFCRNVPQFMIVALGHGFCTMLYGPAANALLTDLVTPAQRVIAFALLRLAINLGFAAGPSIAGLLFSRAPIFIFIGDSLTTLIFAILAWNWLPHGLRTVAGRISSTRVFWSSWRAAWVDATHNRPFWQFLIATLLMSVAFVQVFNVLVIAATHRGLTPAEYGVVMGLNGVLIVLFEVALNQWVSRFDLRRVLVVGFVLVGLGCASFGLMRTQAGFLGAMTLLTAGEMLSLPIGTTYASMLAPEAYRGRYFGLRGMVWALAGVSGSSGVWFYGRLGDAWWYVAGGIGLLGGVVMLAQVMTDRKPAG